MSIYRFAVAGLVSGAISGVATTVPGAALFVPPIAFGIALAVARRSSVGISALFIVANTLAWFATLVIAAVIIRVPVPLSEFWLCVVVSITGPILFVMAYSLSFQPYASEVHLMVVTRVAVVLAVIGLGGAMIAANIFNQPELIGNTLAMTIWQTGVAVAIGLLDRTSSFMAEEDKCHEQTNPPNHNLAQSAHEIAGSPSIERIMP